MSDLSGELIDGRYQLTRQVANGGMASIYEAIDTRLDRKVAVKSILPQLVKNEGCLDLRHQVRVVENYGIKQSLSILFDIFNDV